MTTSAGEKSPVKAAVLPPSKVATSSATGQEPGVMDEGQQRLSQALAHYVTGLLHASHGETTEALKEWEQVVELDPSRDSLRDKLAKEYFNRKDYKSMAKVLELAVEQNPKSAPYWTMLAVAYRADQNWDKATSSSERAMQLDGNIFTPHEILFEVAIENKKPAQARKVLDRAAKRQSDDPTFWVRLADLYASLSLKEPSLGITKEEIIRHYHMAMAMQPGDSELLSRVADFYLLNEDVPNAIEYYDKALLLQPQSGKLRLKLASCYVSTGDRQKAIDILEVVSQQEPFNFQNFAILGELYEEMKKPDRALINYQLSLGANPKQLMPRLKIVLLRMKEKQTLEALKELDQARESFPQTPQVSYFYGLVYRETQDFAKAVVYFEEAERLASASAPDMMDSVFYFYYGSSLERNNEFEKSVVQFKRALELNPDYADAYNYLGFMYADRNVMLDEAVTLIEKALAYEPENGAFLDSLGWAYFRQGKLKDALTYLKSAVKAVGNDSVILEHLGDVYGKMGKTSEALESYVKASESDPKNKAIASKLESLRKSLSATEPLKSSQSLPLPSVK